ncbi:uncharacterized protein A1O5_01086 [Cladophialophora psammophila CBS 110553]|uniref:GH16 domain-containing protein n=1 Tax=Cladophialophora psammophila CBS 110553 TaxID=1182543 RepID=W9X8M3_9EURO|nr:uncharacterized protein A1O5_01086 [Cladophialophora psammophila CBS 110553]EXJ76578.1 hypothetical protein A1O5_01086 [Cladophialophora psammophila CBS 110553]
MKPPEIAGFYVAWCDEFYGPAGSPPSSQNWTLQTPPFNWNHEWQRYTNSTDNAFLDGNGQLVIAPRKVNGQWTSARLHGNHNFGCDPNRKMIFAARIKLGQNPPWQQQGIWPAWWALGQSMRRGTHWPKCGEWDIMELRNGSSTNQGAVHQTDIYGNHAESHGYIDFDRRDYHTWAVLIDLSDGDYSKQTIKFQLDGQTYYTVQGDGSSWATREGWDRCGRSPFFPILNIAVGGDHPGNPNDNTLPGVESGMTIQWLAVYKSWY